VRNFGLVERVPVLRKFLYWIMPKLLDFSDYKSARNRIATLESELEFKKVELLFPEEISRYFQELNQLLFPSPSRDYSIHLKLSGGESDGGYAISTNQEFCQKWITAGLGSHIDFEIALAKQGCSVYGVDLNIGRFRGLSRNLTLVKKYWGNADSNREITLSTMYSESLIENEDNWGFKFDIEGNEWNAIGQILDLENPPSIVACELHNLLPNLTNIENVGHKLKVLKSLAEIYSPVFAKGNNYSAHVIHDGISLYDVLEMSWVRKDKIAKFTSTSNERFQNLNFPNDKARPLYEVGRLSN